MDISRHCKISPINWHSLSEIDSRLEKLGCLFEKIEITVRWYPNTFSGISAEKAIELIKLYNVPRDFDITIYAKCGSEKIRIFIMRSTNIHNQEIFIASSKNVVDETILNSLMEFLNIEADTWVKSEAVLGLERTAFIAYRFDEIGETTALKLTRFLELLSFKVSTGRAYSPLKVSEKVQERISNQSIFFVILTDGENNTWLTQEPTLAKAQGKPVFLLKETNYCNNLGVFADQEYIPFSLLNFEKCFLQILEGLRELRLLDR